MKIAFDLNGVLDTHGDVFWPLIKVLRSSGHAVGLCTGNASWTIPPDWRDYFDFFITCDDDAEQIRVCGRIANSHEEKMRWWKSAAVKEHKVDVLFDDWAEVISGTTAIQILPKV